MSAKQLNFLEPVEIQTRNPSGNRALVPYGIQNEKSDFRAHVGYKTQHIFVFPTSPAQRLLESEHGLNLKSVRIGKIETARGYPVPLSWIEGLQSILIPPDIHQRHRIYYKMSTSKKGLLAVEIVVTMLKRGLVPLPINTKIITNEDLQIQGMDIIVHSQLTIQVKCDFAAGQKKLNGTGNLFFQVAECNPYKLY